MNLNEMSRIALDIAEKREKNGARLGTKTLPMLKHCASEVVEAMEAYGYLANEIPSVFEDIGVPVEEMHANNKRRFASELADIICCVLIIAARENLDVEKAVEDCMQKNKARAEGTGDKI